MTIRRDINPENEKKLDKMLDAKFGNRMKKIVTGDVARLIKARKQFEDTVFDKPKDGEKTTKALTIDEARERHARLRGERKVDKHGSHDQSSHGKARPGGLTMRDVNASQRKVIAAKARRMGLKPSTVARRLQEARRNKKVSKDTQKPSNQRTLPGSDRTTQVTKRPKVGKNGNHDQSTHANGRKAGRLHNRSEAEVDRSVGQIRQASKDLRSGKIDTKEWMRVKERAESYKVSKRKVYKHGQHDQRTHSPSGRASIAREQNEPKGPSSPAPTKVKARVKLQGAMKDVDAILDTFDRGSRVYQELKEVKDIIQSRLRERKEEKVTKAKMTPAQLKESKRLAEDLKGKKDVGNPHALARHLAQQKIDKVIEKGISHSVEILTNALKLIERQEADAEISEADDKKLGEIVDQILGVAGYLDTVQDKGHFEKRTVGKHAQHDQSSHAPTRGGGGGAKAPKSTLSMNSPESANSVAQSIKEGVKKPYVSTQVSTLGGKERPSVMLTISLDPKESWANGILENSRYGKFHVRHDGRVSQISGPLKFRSAKVKDANHLVSLLNTKLKDDDKKVTKGEPHLVETKTPSRPSFTTPAVADQQRKERIKPNAKGRGESTARVPGY